MKLLGIALVVGSIALAALLAWWLLKGRHEGFFSGGGPLATADPKCVYDQGAASSGNRVVLYYADWCPHCVKFKPEFFSAASQANSAGLDAAFVSVNVDKQTAGSDCMTYKGVSGFPTVLLERDGTSPPFAAYNGSRNANDLIAWVKASLPQ